MSVRIRTAALTDRGRRRPRNEDAFLVDHDLGLAAVADGMGGHRAGDIASALAVEELHRSLADRGSHTPWGERMAEAVIGADRRIRTEAAATREREGMGTTLTALLVVPADARIVIAHVGDSRAYVVHEGGMRRLTRDHTWVQEQVDAGAIPASEARGHPRGNILSRALGVGDAAAADVLERDARAGDVYLLCSDGLTNMLTDETMERIVRDGATLGLDRVARSLVDAANEAGGIDNITVVLAGVERT